MSENIETGLREFWVQQSPFGWEAKESEDEASKLLEVIHVREVQDTTGPNEDYPLYVTLPASAKHEADDLIQNFKTKLKEVACETLGEIYCDVLPHIETDSWTNYRNAMWDGLRGSPKNLGERDYKELRDKIYAEHKDTIDKEIRDLQFKEMESRCEALNERNQNQAECIAANSEMISKLRKAIQTVVSHMTIDEIGMDTPKYRAILQKALNPA